MNFSFRIYWHSEGRGPFPRNATPMHILCYLGLDKLVEQAFSARKISMKGGESTWGKPPLTWAAASSRDGIGRTPLHWAAANGHKATVSILLKNNADPQANSNENRLSPCTPMHLAVDYGHMGVFELLVSSATGDDGEWNKWLELASAGGHLELVKKIFSFGVDLDTPVGDYGSALHAAAYEDHIEVVGWLLEKGADVNLQYGKNGTPLQAAAFEGNSDIVRLLLDKGADVNAGGGIHGSPLQAAAYRDWKEIAQLLLGRGANVDAQGGQHGSPIDAAMFSGHEEIVTLLKRHGAIATGSGALRPAFELDGATIHAMNIIETEIVKGRLPGVEKRAEKVIQEFMRAIDKGNKRTLNVLFEIGFSAFKVASRAGREGFLHFIVEKGMVILQVAVHKGFQEGIEMLSKLYTKALAFVLHEGKPVLVEGLLYECVKSLKGLIEDENDDGIRDLETAAIEMFFAVVESEDDKLIKIMAKVWVSAFEDFMSAKFKKDLMQLIQAFGSRWISRINDKDTKKVTLWATACAEILSTAVVEKKTKVVGTLSFLFTQIFEQAFASVSKDTVSWLLNEGRRELSQVDVLGLDRAGVERVVVLIAELLLATVYGGRDGNGQDCSATQKQLLDISVPILKTFEDAGFLETIKLTLQKLGSEKLDVCEDETLLQILKDDFLVFLDEVIEASKGKDFKGALTRVKEIVESRADSIASKRWA